MKAGDTVRCIEDRKAPLVLGQEYTVLCLQGREYVWIEGQDVAYQKSRFEVTVSAPTFEGLESAWDSTLPKVVCNVPMPACKPAKQEPYKVGKLSNEDILGAFNNLTGNNLSADAYEMLLSLQDMFDSRS